MLKVKCPGEKKGKDIKKINLKLIKRTINKLVLEMFSDNTKQFERDLCVFP